MAKIDLEYKLLILGETSVGKTSLLLRYMDDTFDTTLPTVGVDVRCKYIQYDNKRIKLDIWDTAGQERFKGIAKNYFRGANGVIVVFDITSKDSFTKLKYWTEENKSNVNNDIEMIIAENKIDLEDKRVVSKDKIKEYGEKTKLDIFTTSAKTGEGVKEIFKALISRLYSNKNIGAVIDDEETATNKRRNSVLNKKDLTKEKKKNCC